MSLKLFRSTGYSTILTPGETRAGRHPGWVVLALSVWVGLACNVALWRALQSGGSADLLGALLVGVGAGAACATVLSLSGWRRTLKPMATALLLLAAPLRPWVVRASAWITSMSRRPILRSQTAPIGQRHLQSRRAKGADRPRGCRPPIPSQSQGFSGDRLNARQTVAPFLVATPPTLKKAQYRCAARQNRR